MRSNTSKSSTKSTKSNTHKSNGAKSAKENAMKAKKNQAEIEKATAATKGPQKKSIELKDKKLEKVAVKIGELISDANRGDALARHKIGVEVVQVMENKKWGSNAIKQLEKRLGFSVQTLYRYALVAKAWTPTEFFALARKLNAKGVSLSWSHFELLAQKHVSQRRDKLIEEALAESLTSTQLEAKIGGKNGTKAADGSTTNTSQAAAKMSTEAGRLIKHVSQFQADMPKVFDPSGAPLQPDDKRAWEETVEQLKQAAKVATNTATAITTALAATATVATAPAASAPVTTAPMTTAPAPTTLVVTDKSGDETTIVPSRKRQASNGHTGVEARS